MSINLSRMLADIASWQAEIKPSPVKIKTRCFSLEDAGISDGWWTAASAIAFARAMLAPSLEGPGYPPSRALETLERLATVPDPKLALAALQHEKSVAYRLRAVHRTAVERKTVSDGYRSIRRRTPS